VDVACVTVVPAAGAVDVTGTLAAALVLKAEDAVAEASVVVPAEPPQASSKAVPASRSIVAALVWRILRRVSTLAMDMVPF